MPRKCTLPISLTLLIALGCSGNSRQVGTSVGGATNTCPAGSERCDCYGNGTCDGHLECRSNLCVAGENAGGAGVGDSAGNSGAANTGGSISTGGAPVQDTGGATTSSTGGAVATTDSITPGGASSTGGATAAGGTESSGGVSGFGSTNMPGGVTSTGGTSNIISDTSMGATPAVGGGSNSGGTQSTTGGGPDGGQTSTAASTSAQTCGNGIVEGSEGCDPLPHDNDLGDGCTPLCTVEPMCPPAGGPCATRCRDGLVLGSEQCDDGNAVSGDGCSATCQVEDGFNCARSTQWQCV
jgi:cysteine-rich repeat protein